MERHSGLTLFAIIGVGRGISKFQTIRYDLVFSPLDVFMATV